MFKVITYILTDDLADAGTATLAYPSGTSRGDFVGGVGSKVVADQTEYSVPEDFGITLNASDITLTNRLGRTVRAGTIYVQLDMPGLGKQTSPEGVVVLNTVGCSVVQVDLGNPITADADGISVLQTTAGAADLTITGAVATDSVATLDVPRNVTLTGATTDHSAVTATVTGTDAYDNAVVENITCPNNNTVAGKKAFKTVTSVSVDGAIATTGISVGFGDVLGLPVFLPNGVHVLKELQDDAAPTAGTFVAGVTSEPTATTGDVRGTYDPNAACDGSKAFGFIAALPEPNYLGATQYAG